MFSTFHFAKVVLHLRSFPLAPLLSRAGWSSTAGWSLCLKGAHPWQKGSGYPLLMSVMTQVHAQERASGPSCGCCGWLWNTQSQAHQVAFVHLSDTFHAEAWASVLCPAEDKSQSWQRALEVQYTHAYTTWTATASYLVGKREQIVCIFLS